MTDKNTTPPKPHTVYRMLKCPACDGKGVLSARGNHITVTGTCTKCFGSGIGPDSSEDDEPTEGRDETNDATK